MHASPEDFRPPERFQIRNRLGAGGMGVVYEAYDRERQEVVALKRLLVNDAAATYRFKKEFRTLADLSHSNLVTLYELMVEQGQCFFTMELLKGTTFVEFVRRSKSLSTQRAAGPDLERLESALKQLAEGACALHAAGVVHRDLKPANVMVTAEGRVVILDFGLASEFAPVETVVTIEKGLTGTVAYLAPEL